MLEELVDHRSGLLGISGVGSDMRRLHEAASSNADARLAIEMFCYSVRKQVAAMIAVLSGSRPARVYRWYRRKRCRGLRGRRSKCARRLILSTLPHLGTPDFSARYRGKEKTMTATSYSLTPDSASIQPEPQDFEAVEREFGPFPLDASQQEAVHRYRLAQATKILRIFDSSRRTQ